MKKLIFFFFLLSVLEAPAQSFYNDDCSVQFTQSTVFVTRQDEWVDLGPYMTCELHDEYGTYGCYNDVLNDPPLFWGEYFVPSQLGLLSYLSLECPTLGIRWEWGTKPESYDPADIAPTLPEKE